jgi:hypothetical protein
MVAHHAQVLIIKIALCVNKGFGDIYITLVLIIGIANDAQIYAPHAPIIFLVIHVYLTPILMT